MLDESTERGGGKNRGGGRLFAEFEMRRVLSAVGRAGSRVYGDDGDAVEVADPARRALFLSRDDFEGAVGSDGLAFFRVGDDDLADVDGGINFRQGVKDLVAVGAFSNDSGHEEMAADFFSLGYSEIGEEGCEGNAGVCFAGFGVRVIDGDGNVRQRSELEGGEDNGHAVICDGEAGGADGGSMVVHLLRGSVRRLAGCEKQKDGDGDEETSQPHAVILADKNRYFSMIQSDFDSVEADGRRCAAGCCNVLIFWNWEVSGDRAVIGYGHLSISFQQRTQNFCHGVSE